MRLANMCNDADNNPSHASLEACLKLSTWSPVKTATIDVSNLVLSLSGMSLYNEAATILQTTSSKGSFKSHIYGTSGLRSQPSQVYALITEASKCDAFLAEVVERAELLVHEPKVRLELLETYVQNHESLTDPVSDGSVLVNTRCINPLGSRLLVLQVRHSGCRRTSVAQVN